MNASACRPAQTGGCNRASYICSEAAVYCTPCRMNGTTHAQQQQSTSRSIGNAAQKHVIHIINTRASMFYRSTHAEECLRVRVRCGGVCAVLGAVRCVFTYTQYVHMCGLGGTHVRIARRLPAHTHCSGRVQTPPALGGCDGVGCSQINALTSGVICRRWSTYIC